MALALSGGPASADTLKGAMLKAYRTNPSLQAERERQRGTDELVPQAKSGWRPTVTARGSVDRTWQKTNDGKVLDSTSRDLTIQLSQPLFRGFKTIEGTKQAKAIVRSGQHRLVAVEGNLLLQVADSYLAVIRDRRILELRRKNVSNLQSQVNAAQARFDAGEVTRTDVTQAKARLSGAKASMASANATLQSSMARYELQVGSPPGTLKWPGLAKLPRTLEEALAIALRANPNILSAEETRHASEHAIEVAKGDLLPSATINATQSYSYDDGGLSLFGSETTRRTTNIEGVLTVPIYEAGRVYSQVRAAKHLESQRQLEVIAQGRSVRQAVKSSWNDLVAAREAIAAAEAQVGASAASLDGVNQEYLVGSRSTIDVLNAEQELVNARIGLVSAQYSHVLSSYEVQAAIGRLTARQLALGGPYYDVEENYDNVKDKWIGTGADTLR